MMDKIILISELNDGFARLVELSNGERIIMFWDEENEDRVDFRFYKDNIANGQQYCELEKNISGEFTFEDQYADEEYIKDYSTYKLIYMYSPDEYIRMGIGEYILRWFLEGKRDCKYVYTSEPNDLSVRDGSELTGDAIKFVFNMQKKGLIRDPDHE